MYTQIISYVSIHSATVSLLRAFQHDYSPQSVNRTTTTVAWHDHVIIGKKFKYHNQPQLPRSLLVLYCAMVLLYWTACFWRTNLTQISQKKSELCWVWTWEHMLNVKSMRPIILITELLGVSKNTLEVWWTHAQQTLSYYDLWATWKYDLIVTFIIYKHFSELIYCFAWLEVWCHLATWTQGPQGKSILDLPWPYCRCVWFDVLLVIM